jgi:serine/threonine-protein kinase
MSPEFLTLQRAVAGRYSLDHELGRGGMGVVFLARDVALDRPVAIKLLPPSLAILPELRERFLREARTAAKLSHPNIVPIFAVEEHGDLVFFVMGFVDGESLGQRVRRAGPLAASAAIRLIQEVAWALAYAHGRGVIHRDIKPDNILIEKGSGRALVTDFGIARIADQSGVTAKGEILGTVHYMSPEQATGEPLDGRSDLYALGVTAYFALTATLPFDGAALPAVLTRVLTEAPPRIAVLRPHLPARLAEAVDRCLAKTPAERFATGEELEDAAGTALVARGETPPEIRLLLRRAQEGDYWLGLFFILLNALPILIDELWPVNHRAAILIGLMLGAQVVGFPIAMLLSMRRVLKAGLGPSDVQRAIEQATSDRVEEHQLLHGGWTGTALPDRRRILTLVGGGVFVGGLGLWVAGVPLALLPVFTGGFILLGSLVTRLQTIEDWGKRRAMGLGLRLLNSRLGRFLFKIAGLGVTVGQQNVPPATERTELVLGDAAGVLFDALPSEVRKRFREVPATIKRLEEDARVLRAREQALSEALARADPDRAVSVGTERRGRAKADLAEAREAARERLATAVAALENIRLDLLKLQAGVGSVDDLTADLESAREINDAVNAELAARNEVERVLKG